ncbi:hypothetical protein SAMN02745119_00755 [Trichlorobacter thiogenes]|uniref:DUF4062 domain-containing protein n=1 Tax=Trichlorobacter thiogenes TaxID=115783 RepID=A0A1T4L4M5_9BACT|nr:hypothetical protein [Trichlorobacter thiogenes]SJZ49470.1 hypothetical protein SAMN02745119_00755 [Trichlorobacter thiogenes]
MAYQATVIPVMIASPGDVDAEREAIRAVIHDWNDVNASESKVVLNPVGWETHSSPELGARPQELINSRLLDDCDVLIGVFWTRLGTPTGEAQSGTVEEIERHVAKGRPVMIYFSSKPVAPQSIDATQFAELQAFREKLKPRGLVETFDNLEQFRSKVSKQLQLCLNNNPYLKELTQPVSKAEPINVTHPPLPTSINLTDEACTLLRAASKEDSGVILKRLDFSGSVLVAGVESFGGVNGREAAKWENALSELQIEELVVNSGNNIIFKLTHKGWQVADAIKD